MNKYKTYRAEFGLRNGDKIIFEFVSSNDYSATLVAWRYFLDLIKKSALINGVFTFCLKEDSFIVRECEFNSILTEKFFYEYLFQREYPQEKKVLEARQIMEATDGLVEG